MKKHNCRIMILTAFLLPLTAALSSCADNMCNADDTCKTVTESEAEATSGNAPETLSDEKEKDFSDVFTYRVKDGYIRINRYEGGETSVVIPDVIEGLPVKAINENAFANSPEITEITLPAGLEEISAKILSYPKGLQNVYISEKSGKYISVDGVIYTADGKTLAMYPMGRTGEAEIAEGAECIGDRAFYGCNIDSVTLPERMEKIGKSAFEGCGKLVNIQIPGSVKEIGAYSFCGSGLEKVTLNEGIEKIGTGAFERTAITEIYLPDSVYEAGSYILGSERGAAISAAAPAEGLKPLDKYENLTYRNETILNAAIRQAERIAKRHNEYYSYRAYLTDVNGDDFPEMLYCRTDKIDGKHKEYPYTLYCYNSEDMKWERAADSGYDYHIIFCRDRETGENVQFNLGCYNEVAYALEAVMSSRDRDYSILTADSSLFYPIGYYSDNEGYIAHFNGGGKFEIYNSDSSIFEADPDNSEKKAFAEFVKSTPYFERYELLGETDIYGIYSEALEKSAGEESDSLVLCGHFADLPDPGKADFEISGNGYMAYLSSTGDYAGRYSSEVIIGGADGRHYDEFTYHVFLANDEITEENFEQLSRLPCLTSLSLYCDDPEGVIDLTGIEKLEKLHYLNIGHGDLKNAELLYDMDIQWLGVSGEINDLAFMADLDSVCVLDIGYSLDRPADFYSAVSGMDSLKYIVESVWDINVTEEQHENITALRPDVKFCHYKV